MKKYSFIIVLILLLLPVSMAKTLEEDGTEAALLTLVSIYNEHPLYQQYAARYGINELCVKVDRGWWTMSPEGVQQGCDQHRKYVAVQRQSFELILQAAQNEDVALAQQLYYERKIRPSFWLKLDLWWNSRR